MAAKKKTSKAATRAKSRKQIERKSSIPTDPRLFSRVLLSAEDDRSVERLANEYLALGKRAFRPGKLNPLADIFYKMKDTVGAADLLTWDQFVLLALRKKFLLFRSYEYYPFDNVPVLPVYPLSKVKPYDDDPRTEEELMTEWGPSPGNPDNEISLTSGYASFHPENGDGILQAVLINGRAILGYGPAITIDTDAACTVRISCSVSVAYLFTFDASVNPNFDPNKYLTACFMSGELRLKNQFDVWDKTSGAGYGSMTLDNRVIRSVGLFPEGTAVPTGTDSPEIYFGLARQQFSDDLTVTYKTQFSLEANSRCQFHLSLMSDVTAVGPRNGRWNRFICNSQVQASATFPRVDVDVWPA